MEDNVMKNRIAKFTAAVLLSTTFSYACDIHGITGFAPENDMRISVFDKDTNGMTEQRFNDIISRVEKVYAPVVQSKNAQFEVKRNWTDDTVNAFAQRMGSVWQVQMFGGLARHPVVTDDGFMLVMCHETGHHLGGAPKKGGVSGRWASNEGQSDYFGSMKCMRRVLENDDNVSIVTKIKVDAEATKACQSVYTNENEIALCQRIAMAGKSLALLLSELSKTTKVAFNTPNKMVVTKTNDAHPEAQCRLDTYFSGILCDKSWDQDVSDKNPVTGVCIKKDGHQVGTRPLCWYKPTSQEI
jgi:hypothetical protein